MQRNMEQVYEAEIKLLQEEILMIQNQLENNEREVALHFRELTQNDVPFHADLRGRKKDIIMNLKLELENMEADLARQTKMNGIELTTCEMKTLEKSQTKTVQQHRLSGHCQYLAFQVEFEVTEVQEESSVSRIVTDLNIVVDGCEFSDISTFVSGAEERKSLLLFFRTLKGFSQRCEHRNRTFLHFKVRSHLRFGSASCLRVPFVFWYLCGLGDLY
ncbi:hypothetical protein AGOR_G00153150 [Albula goreensis]|uniref:Centromere protein P n=1 Tax=Albula goreensis TaxID=1534307 RepID=A0A8T3D304_9TELE|nr:hypothetical protein AGOR_G00153150 [Albula goreensis]